jgi:hypothetical protein
MYDMYADTHHRALCLLQERFLPGLLATSAVVVVLVIVVVLPLVATTRGVRVSGPTDSREESKLYQCVATRVVVLLRLPPLLLGSGPPIASAGLPYHFNMLASASDVCSGHLSAGMQVCRYVCMQVCMHVGSISWTTDRWLCCSPPPPIWK